MTRVRTNIRVAPGRHRTHKVRNTERFWTDYVAARTQNGIFLAQNTERFWIEYVERPHHERSTSVPPTPRLRDGGQKPTSTGPARSWLQNLKGTYRRILNVSSKKFRQGTARLRCRRPSYRKLAVMAAAGGALLLCLYSNDGRAARNAALRSPVLDRYHKFPTWMHTDPVQVIGLPAMVSRDLVPNTNEVQRAWKVFARSWRPQFFADHGFDTYAQAEHAYKRGEAAYNAIIDYTDSPWCDLQRQPLETLRQRNATYTDGLPQFASPCQCTYASYLLQRALRPFIPAGYATPPQSEADIARFCLCNETIANASWETFTPAKQPPPLHRILDSLPWWTPDSRVWRFKQHAREQHLDRMDFTVKILPSKVEACLKGDHELCKNVPGWVSAQDFDKLASPSRCHNSNDTIIMRAKMRREEREEMALWNKQNGVVDDEPEEDDF
ncbi:hypothetical protein SVAN01_04950 [Stagonosporopsis vannaccii]|nr:hypothetical protein SVAN01_04950 [Stagonosporopsis vannaccii]